MKVYVVDVYWYYFGEKELRIFDTKDKAIAFIKNTVKTHKSTEMGQLLLRNNDMDISVDEMVHILLQTGRYVNEWLLGSFKIELIITNVE